MKKLFALLFIALLLGCISSAEESGLNYVSDFSSDLDGWFPRSAGGAQAQIVDGALYISGRTASWNSPGRYFELVPGSEYQISCEVMQESVDSAEFMISVAHSKNNTETYENLVHGHAAKGKWTTLSCSYTFGDFDQYVLYVETIGNATLDFSIRDFKVLGESMTYDTSIPRLKEVYAPYFDFGCAVTQIEALNTQRMDFYATQFSIMTCGNELKPDYVIDIPASREASLKDETAVEVKFDAAKPLLDYCFRNGISVHGHTLVWHNQTPEAFFHVDYDPAKPFVSREMMLSRLENYICKVMRCLDEAYPGLIVSWDVVNEAVDDATGRLRSSNWTKVVGEDFVLRAFEYARRYAPEGTLLFYNDYSTPYEPKLSGILSLLDSLIEEGNIDGYGFQAHYELTSPTISMLHNALEKVVQKGLLIRVSELDVKVSALNDSAFTMQAGRYEALMKEFLSFSDSIIAVHTWGVSDDLSWLANKYPLLFNKNLTPKPAFYKIIGLVS